MIARILAAVSFLSLTGILQIKSIYYTITITALCCFVLL